MGGWRAIELWYLNFLRCRGKPDKKEIVVVSLFAFGDAGDVRVVDEVVVFGLVEASWQCNHGGGKVHPIVLVLDAGKPSSLRTCLFPSVHDLGWSKWHRGPQ